MASRYSELTRRRFLLGTGAWAAGAALPGIVFADAAATSLAAPPVPAGSGTAAPRLVVVILRGALDGLSAVPPYADPAYAALRGELAIAAPGSADGALALDGPFGLHPSLRFLHERYSAGELIVFHAASSPYRDRSHFDGQNVLENGLSKPIGSADGWLNRSIAALPRDSRVSDRPVAERAVAVSQNVPLILRGDSPVISKSPQMTADMDEDLLARLQDLYSEDEWFSARLSEAISTEKMADGAADTPAASMQGSNKAGSDRVASLASMAAHLMRSESGPQIAVFEANGWDTHANQGAARGVLAQRLGGLDTALRTLSDGLGPMWSQTAVLVVTEFGRTAAMNGTRGTDHGTGSCAFLTGGAVRGGRVISDWPGLSRTALLDGRDLKPTLDLRSVFKAVLGEHLHIDARSLDARVFPDSSGARPLQGLMRA